MVHLYSLHSVPAPERRRELGDDRVHHRPYLRHSLLAVDAERAKSLYAHSAVKIALNESLGFDVNNSGKLDRKETLAARQDILDRISKLLKKHDLDHKGYLNEKEKAAFNKDLKKELAAEFGNPK